MREGTIMNIHLSVKAMDQVDHRDKESIVIWHRSKSSNPKSEAIFGRVHQ